MGGLAVAAAAAGPAVTHAQVTPVQHVVVLYMENHSFDNVLGYWCDSQPGRCPDGGMPSSVTLKDGTVVAPGLTPDVVPPIDHGVNSQVTAIDGGKMDGWASIKGCTPATGYACIGGYRPQDEPNTTSLAGAFAIGDNTFSMGDSPSWGGHLYAAMASLDGFLGLNPVPAKGVRPHNGWGCNSDKVSPWKGPTGPVQWNVPSCVPDPALGLPNGGAFKPTPVPYAPTIFDRLDAAGLPWRIYVSDASRTDGWAVCPSLAECWYTAQRTNMNSTKQLAADAAGGHLPAFAIITPGGANVRRSEHNGFSMTAGDNWIGTIAHEIMTSPEWRSTVLFITWDDCGCFYDQVPPAVNPDGTAQGPRVPLIIVSPFAKAGYTDTGHATFAGILGYTEQTFGLAPLGANDAQAYAFGNAFNYSQAPRKPIPMVTRPVPATDRLDWSQAGQDT